MEVEGEMTQANLDKKRPKVHISALSGQLLVGPTMGNTTNTGFWLYPFKNLSQESHILGWGI